MPKTKRIGVLLFDGFSMHCLANTVEPLRAANTLSRQQLYAWDFIGFGGAVTSSSGLPVTPDVALPDHPGGDLLMVLPSYGFRDQCQPQVLRSLRAARRRFAAMAGLDMGAWLMAQAGLLDGRQATVHWDELTLFAESFPQVDVVSDRFVPDPELPSCGGGETALELSLDLLARHHGAMLSLQVAALFMHGEPRPDLLPQSTDRIVRAAASRMRRNLETPLSIPDIAAELGLSLRRLEHRFRKSLGRTPTAVYRSLRLSEARRLAETTGQTISEIATRCGYEDPSALTRAYRAEFGSTPSQDRAR